MTPSFSKTSLSFSQTSLSKLLSIFLNFVKFFSNFFHFEINLSFINSFLGEVYLKMRVFKNNWEKFEKNWEVYFKLKEVWEKLGEVWTNLEKFRKTGRSKTVFERSFDKLREVYFKMKVWTIKKKYKFLQLQVFTPPNYQFFSNFSIFLKLLLFGNKLLSNLFLIFQCADLFFHFAVDCTRGEGVETSLCT